MSELEGLKALLKARKVLLALETDPARRKIIQEWIKDTEGKIAMLEGPPRS
jgi:bacterioferritin (cytochrome b1)